jgi:hypothetical protein
MKLDRAGSYLTAPKEAGLVGGCSDPVTGQAFPLGCRPTETYRAYWIGWANTACFREAARPFAHHPTGLVWITFWWSYFL